MHISNLLNVDKLASEVQNGYIRVAKHESLPLKLYTYTDKTSYESRWNTETEVCRGLVVEDNGQVVAHCLRKFWNSSEHANGKSYAPPLPERLDFEIFAKMDGSMGTTFFYEDNWHVASKGSFHSEQAKWATDFLRNKLSGAEMAEGTMTEAASFDPLNKQKTYVCEIIYPTNRIVVDYGTLEDLVLLTVFDNRTGEEEFTEERKLEWGWVGSIVPYYEAFGISVAELQLLSDENVLLDEDNGDRTVAGTDHEGYVVRFSDGTRCKVKLSDYLRLHKIITNCTERSIWEALVEGGSKFESLLGSVPDEFYSWVVAVTQKLKNEHERLILEALEDFRYIVERTGTEDKKAFALEAVKQPSPSALFLLWDGNDTKMSEWAWKQIKPAATKPFRTEDSA